MPTLEIGEPKHVREIEPIHLPIPEQVPIEEPVPVQEPEGVPVETPA